MHINKRLKSRSKVQLPVEPLLVQYQDPSSITFVTVSVSFKEVKRSISQAWWAGCDHFCFSWLPSRASLAIKLLAQTCPNSKTVKTKEYVDGLLLIKT